MKRILNVAILMCLLISSAYAQTPSIMWWFDVDDMSFGNSASADVDKDSKPELIFSNYRNDSNLYVLNAEDGSLLWKVNTGGCNDVAPLVYDVDNDDTLDIILPSSCVAKTFCYNGFNGKLIWQATSAGSDSPPTIADLDNDSLPEILHGEFGGTVRCLNAEDGSLKWLLTVDNNSWIQTEPVIADFNDDGQADFMVANWNFGTDHKFFAYTGNDHTLLWEKDYPEDVMYHGASVADIDLDGKPELAIGSYDGKLYVLNAEDGSLLFDYAHAVSYYAGAPTSIADLDNDGHFEIVYVDYDVIAAVSDTGSLKWEYTIPDYGTSFRGAALADVNSDAYTDVVFGTSNGDLIALSGQNGNELWVISLAAHIDSANFEIDHGPVIRDFDGDGDMDIFVVGGHAEYPDTYKNWGRAYAVSANAGTGPDWPMFRRDVLRHACVCDSMQSGLAQENADYSPFIAFPNPCSGRLFLKTPSDTENPLSVYMNDASGKRCFSARLPARQTDHILDVSGLPAGFYTMNIFADKQVVRKKILVLPH